VCFRRCLLAAAAALAIGACAGENWRWDWWNQEQNPSKPKTVTKNQRPAGDSRATQPRMPPKTEASAAKKDEDPQSRELQEKVDRYVDSMNTSADGAPAYNDFNTKIERQQDPNRRSRVRRVAEQSREDAAATEGSRGRDRLPPTPERGSRSEVPQTSPPQPTEKAEAPEEKQDAGMVKANEGTQTQKEEGTDPAIEKTAEKAGEAPVVEEVTVSAAPEAPVEAEKPAAEAANRPNVAAAPPEPVDTFKKRLSEQEALVAKDPNNLPEQYRLRMMYLIDGQDDKATALAEGVDAENQQILQTQVRALLAARSSMGRDPATWATELLEPVEDLRSQVRAKADLMVPKVLLCTSVEAFGMYEPIEPAQFQAGQKNPVIVYIEVDNFKSESTPSGLHRTLLSVRPSLLNKTGEELWNTRYDNIEDLSRRQRRDFFLTVKEVLPASLPPGEYALKVEVEDVLAGKINSNTAKFKIAP
jgi:hypothetical protein